MIRMPALQIAIGLGAFSLAGLLMYIHYKNRDEEEDELNVKTINRKPSKTSTVNTKDISMQFVLSNDKIAPVMGRGGSNLKMIEEKTSTLIRFREKDDNNQYCEIIGRQDAVHQAKEMIAKEINRSSIIKEEIFVPQAVCGKIIGRCGDAIQEICRKSLAKVSVESGDRTTGNSTRRVVITGTVNQVNIAKNLIEEKIKEDENCRKQVEETESKREPRRSPTTSASSLSSSLTSLGPSSNMPCKEKFHLAESENQLIDVYVSAIASPEKFWLQLIGPQTKKLDELVGIMTRYYDQEENRNLHKIADPYLGQIVTALFKYDGKWYRAEIVGILPNEYNPRDVVLDLYFVDYGDSEYVAPHEVFELRTDFLTLRFQAIECYLAHVKPTISNDQDMWDPSAVTKFEELTHVASWKKLKSRIVTYKERPKGGNHIRREGSPVPGVELFDTVDGTDINIAYMLISHGYAMMEPPEPNDVLRLGGGQYSNFHSVDNEHEKTVTNMPADIIGAASLDHTIDEPELSAFLTPRSVNDSSTHNNNNNVTNHRNATEDFLESEKENGFSQASDKPNFKQNDPQWSHLIS